MFAYAIYGCMLDLQSSKVLHMVRHSPSEERLGTDASPPRDCLLPRYVQCGAALQEGHLELP
jgi:hypothetical protein